MKQESYKVKALVPKLIKIIMLQLLKAFSTRQTPMCLMSTHSLVVRQAGQNASPISDRKLSTFVSTMKRQGRKSILIPTNVIGYLCMGVLQFLDLYMSAIKNQQLIKDYLPIQMLCQSKYKTKSLFHNDTALSYKFLLKNCILSILPLPLLHYISIVPSHLLVNYMITCSFCSGVFPARMEALWMQVSSSFMPSVCICCTQ